MNAIKLNLDTKSTVFSDFGYSLQLQCGSAPQQVSSTGTGQIVLPFSGHTGPHELLQLSILASIDGMYQIMSKASAKINPGSSKSRNVSVKFESKTGAFDPFELSISYVIIRRSVDDFLLDIKHNVCLSVQAQFHGDIPTEDLVLRLLDQSENCLGMCTITQPTSSTALVLNSSLSSSDLQLSVAGENSGLSWIPMRWGAPMAWVVPVGSAGYLLLSAQLMEGKGQTVIQISQAECTLSNENLSDVLIYAAPLLGQPGSFVASSSDARSNEYPPGAAELQKIVDGVKTAPVMSRSEVSRGPSKGSYVLSSRSSSSLLLSHDPMDGQMEHKIQMTCVVLQVKNADLSTSTDNAAFAPSVSVLGYAILTIDPSDSKENQCGSRLSGALTLTDGRGGQSMQNVVSVDVKLTPLTTRPPQQKVVKPGFKTDAVEDASPATNGEDTETSPAKLPSEQDKLKSSEQLLFDSTDDTVCTADGKSTTPAEEKKVNAPIVESLEAGNTKVNVESVADPDATVAVVPTPNSSKAHESPKNLDTPTVAVSPGRADSTGAVGNVGFPVNPRHVLSSSSVIMNGGSTSQTNSSAALADTLSTEIQAKQRMIDKMNAELRMKQELLKHVEGENASLKGENSRIKLRIAEAHTALARRDQESDDAAKYVQELSGNPDDFTHWDRELLVHLIREAAVHIRRLETEAQGLRETVAATEKIRAKYGNICTQLSELQDAHLTQAKYMQKLKERASKVNSFEDTIKAQEEVISRMQTVLETQLRSRSAPRAPGVTLSQTLLSKKLPGKKESDASSTSDTITATKQPLFTEEDPQLKKELAELKKENEKLNSELDIRNRRVESLEKQLISSAHEASKEISKLRTKLLDYELNHVDTQPMGSKFDGDMFETTDSPSVGGSDSTKRLRQQLMVPFESMSNTSFEKELNNNPRRQEAADSGLRNGIDELDDDDFQQFRKTNFSSTSSRNNGSRPTSGTNRLESLVKPLGGGGHLDDNSYY